MSSIRILLIISFSILTLNHTFGKSKGREIRQLIEKKNQNYISVESKLEMILIDAYGQKVNRELIAKTLEDLGAGDKSMVEFLYPLDVKGTKLLTLSYPDKDNDQWLYLPSLKRVKRISSRSKTSSFMGSEFSYEDLSPVQIEKFNYKLIKEEKLDGRNTWILERRPLKKSGISKTVSYQDKEYFGPLKVEYYDRKEELLKVAYFSDYKKYQVNGKQIFFSDKIHMKNVQTKKETIITWKERAVGKKIKPSIFRKSKLKR